MERDPVYIFLDIDGVLNSAMDWMRSFPLDNRCIHAFCDYVHELERDGHDVNVVLSSTWREGFDPQGGHSPQVAKLVQQLGMYGVSIVDRTPEAEDLNRGWEVRQYIETHGLERLPCVVIDDTQELFQSPMGENVQLYLTNARVGFTSMDAKRLLGRKSGPMGWLQSLARLFRRRGRRFH